MVVAPRGGTLVGIAKKNGRRDHLEVFVLLVFAVFRRMPGVATGTGAAKNRGVADHGDHEAASVAPRVSQAKVLDVATRGRASRMMPAAIDVAQMRSDGSATTTMGPAAPERTEAVADLPANLLIESAKMSSVETLTAVKEPPAELTLLVVIAQLTTRTKLVKSRDIRPAGTPPVAVAEKRRTMHRSRRRLPLRRAAPTSAPTAEDAGMAAARKVAGKAANAAVALEC